MNDTIQPGDGAAILTEREKALQEKLGSRTLLVVLMGLIALVELLVIVRLAV